MNIVEVRRTSALVTEQLKRKKEDKQHSESHVEVLDNRIFIRHGGKMIKLLTDDILYIEAERNYCTIVTTDRNYTVAITLKSIEEKLPSSRFVRVHRSYMINISKLDSVAEDHLEIIKKSIPLSKSYKEVLLSRIQTI